MPRRRTTNLARNTPVQRRYRRMRANEENVPPPDQADVPEPAENGMLHRDPLQPLPQAFTYNHHEFQNVFDVGTLRVQCLHCTALKFPNETAGMCCCNGKVDLRPLPQPPQPLAALFDGTSENSRHFLENIRKYNCAFQLTSFGCNEVTLHGWNPQFRIQGQVCHLIGPLMPPTHTEPSFLQIYFMDGTATDQVERRIRVTDGLRPEIILDLQETLHANHTYVRELKSAYEFANRNFPDYRIAICESRRPAGTHERTYNAPTVSEVAVLMPNDPVGQRDIILHTRANQLQRICELHRAYDTLQYPLLIPHGTDGWSLGLKITSRYKITQLQYYCFHFFTRIGNFILQARRLFQQFMVDAYAKVESERLQFLRREQGRLRADNYRDLRDTIVHQDGDPRNVGQKIILPATFCGGPRYMFERQQDAMAYVRKFGRPDLFVTVTTNPKWPEILECLTPGQQPHDRPDLLVRVFRLKIQKLMKILKDGCFGSLEAWLYSIEFQKRGLPHIHILLWLSHDAKIHPNMIDNVVSAELPDKEADPELSAIVTANMIHGPCGNINPLAPCMKDGKCSKNFPRPFLQNTEVGTDSYPKYRRRSEEDGGGTCIKVFNNSEIQIDNRWVVPYNPWLLRQINCHANVEICASIKSIKYVLKYVHKGADQATFQLQQIGNNDEISNFVNARYIGSTEAAWRIFEMPITERFPPVVQLAIHLENGQRVYFNEETAAQTAAGDPPATTLTSFFTLCVNDDFARNLLYADVPKYYTWESSTKSWKRRKRGKPTDTEGVFETSTIGRIYTISPRQGDCFYLRLLLLSVRGPTSFQSVRTFEGTVYLTFREASIARGLLEDDNMQRTTLQEASLSQVPQALRNLFAILITHTSPSNPSALWQEFKHAPSEDFVHHLDVTQEAAYNMTLISLEDIILSMGVTSLIDLGMPQPDRVAAERTGQEYRREINYDIAVEQQTVNDRIQLLTPEQAHVYTQLNEMLEMNQGGLCFLDAPGGCGKTFLIKTVLASLRGQGKIAIATASSGLAATLLPGGRTLHSTFKVPLNIVQTDTPICPVKKGTALARVFQEASILVIDEAPMLHRKVLEAVDKTLRDLRSSDQVMGGLLTLLCGDFRQILPVVPQGTRANIVDACLKRSQLWRFVKKFSLTTNMRAALIRNNENRLFAENLLNLGNGNAEIITEPDIISLDDFGISTNSVDTLLNMVFPDFLRNYTNQQWITERAILAPLNETVTHINSTMAEWIPAPFHSYNAYNTVVNEEEAVQYPVEFLNSIEVSGLPPHMLRLKVGMPVMLLRSLKPPQLMNGTRCIVTSCMRNVIEVEIAVGAYMGERHFIPRIPLQPSDTSFPFIFQRKQFPLRPSFSITINKAQGQTFNSIGLDLRQPVFAHGMLYVAVSRTGDNSAIYFLTPNGETRNVVYKEIL